MKMENFIGEIGGGEARVNAARGGAGAGRGASEKHWPQYALRKGLGVWELIFEGRCATLKHEQGIYYVSYLLTHPPGQPIHGLALSLKAALAYQPRAGLTQVLDPVTLQPVAVAPDAVVLERSPALDSTLAAARLRRRQLQLEAILEDHLVSDQDKAEAERELEEIYRFQKRNPGQVRSAAQRAVHSVRTAMLRFHRRCETALDTQGQPHPVLRPFAVHLEDHLLVPSGRYSNAALRARAGLAGCFTYDPPAGVLWAS